MERKSLSDKITFSFKLLTALHIWSYHAMSVVAIWAILATFPVMAVVTLQHILDWVKQEQCGLEDEAIGRKEVDRPGWDRLDSLSIIKD